jgi:hypothetical protein
MLDAWSHSLSALYNPAAPTIDWPRERRSICTDGLPRREVPPKVTRPAAELARYHRREDITDADVLAAIGAGATTADVAAAIGTRAGFAWRRLRRLEDAGSVRGTMRGFWVVP